VKEFCYKKSTMPRKEKKGKDELIMKVVDRVERAKEELEVKDSLLAELYVSHIAQRQTIKTEFQVKRRMLEQRHEEESVRMDSEILKIKAEMDVLEAELAVLVSETEEEVVNNPDDGIAIPSRSSEPDFSSFSLPCPSCPVCRTAMAPPTVILQCTNGHLVCEPCHAKLHVTTCRTCLGEYVGRALGLEQYLQSLFLD